MHVKQTVAHLRSYWGFYLYIFIFFYFFIYIVWPSGPTKRNRSVRAITWLS